MVFSNNVVITQGSIVINADKVTITRSAQNTGQKEVIEAVGKPVRFSQQLDNGQQVQAYANSAHYDLSSEFLTLTGNAELMQGSSKTHGEHITYDVKAEQLKATGSKNSRVKTIIVPSQFNLN